MRAVSLSLDILLENHTAYKVAVSAFVVSAFSPRPDVEIDTNEVACRKGISEIDVKPEGKNAARTGRQVRWSWRANHT